MNTLTKELAKQAGFKIFGDRIVAADGNSSGAATQCLEKFVKLMAYECARICSDRALSADFSYTPAKALVAKRTATGCATLIKETFGV